MLVGNESRIGELYFNWKGNNYKKIKEMIENVIHVLDKQDFWVGGYSV